MVIIIKPPRPAQPIPKPQPPTPPKPPPKPTPPPTPPPKPPAPTPKPPQKKEAIITRIPYPKWWREAKVWPLTINTAGWHVVIPNTPGYKTYISTIVFTVSGKTSVTFNIGNFGPSGTMKFGDEDEPRGMVIAMGNSPMPCGYQGFSIQTDGAGIELSGFIVYYYEQDITQKV